MFRKIQRPALQGPTVPVLRIRPCTASPQGTLTVFITRSTAIVILRSVLPLSLRLYITASSIIGRLHLSSIL
ncbi:hypothetical protein G7K_2735-t1 [Saitoella complicata NRRL Y-17804]|uniref:Uncharacterized protein n=1 Tax=Saitoella complicata (strain BCRC 22490 / CBS 7301 / JCM 7358 / NBRC 10748 / NRRL Y-17804) TaxID=698492 RepID=A0A0E9NFC3_SAICN|nr:hypothetical protein G7K_2735-t1 [Saitoella complicata NRRL Y-17804]